MAQDVFEALARRRFDVYLDRFRTAPGTDFVDRITDELRDKSMVVLVESATAAVSPWVRKEIAVANRNRYGLLAINVGGAVAHPWIGESRRLRLGRFDPDLVA